VTVTYVKLGEVMATRAGTVDPTVHPDEVFDLYSIPAFDKGVAQTLPGAEIGSVKQIVAPNDVLLSKIIPHIRRSWVVPPPAGRRQIASGEWIVFRSKSVYPAYLRHIIISDDFHRRFMTTVAGVGGSLLRAQPKRVANIRIPLPAMEEQQRIACVLDRVEAACSKRQQTLVETDELMRSTFLDMFGDLDTAGGCWVKVTDLVATGDAIRTGPFGSQLLHSEFQQEGVAVLGIDSVVRNEFRWIEGRCISDAKYRQLKRYTVRRGDVLITIMGTCGRCAVVPAGLPPAINTKHLCCITLDKTKCLPEFLQSYFLWHPVARRYLERTAKGAIMSGLNMGIIKALPVPVVPLEDQAVFVARQETCQHLRTRLRSSRTVLDQLFASLRQRAFAGTL
jgi:type I restriction enzyme, S subunit